MYVNRASLLYRAYTSIPTYFASPFRFLKIPRVGFSVKPLHILRRICRPFYAGRANPIKEAKMEVKFNFFGFVLASAALLFMGGVGYTMGEQEGRKRGIEKTIDLLTSFKEEEEADQ